MAGGPSNSCISCTDVLVNLAPLSPTVCDAGSQDPVYLRITFKSESGLPDAEGFCADLNFTEDVNSNIDTFSAVA